MILIIVLINAFNEAQSQAIITLLAKEGKESSQLNNWGPMSLLHTNYKILY